MSELPCIGAGITIVDPGKHSKHSFRWSTGRLLRAHVVSGADTREGRILGADRFHWKSGVRTGQARADQEGVTWVHGHGPQARASLLAARKLAGLD